MTTPATDEQIAELEGLLEKATEGPWKPVAYGGRSEPGLYRCEVRCSDTGPDELIARMGRADIGDDQTNAALIAAARNLLPALIVRLRAAEAERDSMEEAWLKAEAKLSEGAEDRIRADERERLRQIAIRKTSTSFRGDIAEWIAAQGDPNANK